MFVRKHKTKENRTASRRAANVASVAGWLHVVFFLDQQANHGTEKLKRENTVKYLKMFSRADVG